MVDPTFLSVVTRGPAQRPKRGRRRKRPELTDEQRRSLRALQNRQATRRSRERTRAKAEELKTQLEHSEMQREALRQERDRLLARVNVNAGTGHTTDPSQSRRNPMSLSVILNDDDNDYEYVFTPPSKRSRAMSCETSPVSISSPSLQRFAFQKTVHDFT